MTAEFVDTATGELIAACTADEARALTERIKDAAEAIWSLLLEAHERRAWSALGYARWEDYVRAEFDMARAHSYRLLDQARVIREIESVSPFGDIPSITEAEARDIKPVLRDVTREVQRRVTAMPSPAPERVKEIVSEVITETRREIAEQRDRRAVVAELNALAPAGFDAEADKARIALTFRVFDSVEKLTGLPEPGEFVHLIYPQSAHRLGALRAAADWLTAFADAWESRDV